MQRSWPGESHWVFYEPFRMVLVPTTGNKSTSSKNMAGVGRRAVVGSFSPRFSQHSQLSGELSVINIPWYFLGLGTL